MKKLLTLLLALLMCASPAFAAEVLQDGEAPEIFEQVDVYGIIYDADGNEVAAIPADGIIVTDISDRASAADEATAARLAAAYGQMMQDVHHSDVESGAGDNLLKDDINAALAGTDYTAFDLVMYEKFDVSLTEEYAALLTDGCVLEVRFAMQGWEPAPVLVFHYSEGTEWHIVHQFHDNGDGTVTIRMRKPGVLTFVMTQAMAIESGDSYTETQVIPGDMVEGEYPVDMSNFTPSVAGKPAPQVVSFVYYEEDEIIEVEYTDTLVQVVPLRQASRLVLTPLSLRKYVADIQTYEHLEWAYHMIASADSLSELPSTTEGETIGSVVDQVLAGTGLTCRDMIVRDLFEITIYGEYLKDFYNEETHIHATFDVKLEPGTPFVVLLSHDSITWSVLPAEDVQVNEDGTVTVCVHDMGVFAFLVDAAGYMPAEGAVMSPATEG